MNPMRGMARGPVILPAGAGRTYAMPGMRAVIKADGGETGGHSCVSEWWVDPHCKGPGAHSHEANDEIFYGIGGTMAVLGGDTWHDVGPGSFLLIPAGTIHDFENRTEAPAGLLNVFVPGGFEAKMTHIVQWYADNAAR